LSTEQELFSPRCPDEIHGWSHCFEHIHIIAGFVAGKSLQKLEGELGVQAGQQRERAVGAENSWVRDRTITTPQPKVPDDILDVGNVPEGTALQSDLEFWSTIRGERN
jgi:hypothetical protein